MLGVALGVGSALAEEDGVDTGVSSGSALTYAPEKTNEVTAISVIIIALFFILSSSLWIKPRYDNELFTNFRTSRFVRINIVGWEKNQFPGFWLYAKVYFIKMSLST
jgi:hypothetical protein